jgi:hypothetical protein
MLTIFSMPKAFRGHVGTIQRNALKSWTLLRPAPEIFVFGNEAGTADAAREAGARHFPQVAVNELETPLLSDLFRQAEGCAASELLCYLNADILLPPAFTPAVELVQKGFSKFVMVSRRINVDVAEPLDFAEGWESKLGVQGGGPASGDYTAIDVFVFGKGTYRRVPDFAIGRLWFDQWLIKAALEQNLPLIDASRVAPVLHQNHDYNHVPGGEDQVWRGREAARNFALYGGVRHTHTLLDATHEIAPSGKLRRIWLRRPLVKMKEMSWELFVRRTVPLRDALRLRRKFWRRGAANSQS